MVIQRGWKILSDTGSTSASSTEANRSPMGGLNSSSDDSNCSNQTTHSMVTSVASPPNSSTKIETTSITANTSTNSHHHQQTNETTMKFITTPQMAENTLQKLRQRYSNTTPLTSSSAESAMRSLELVRIAVQSAFDKEIDEMVKHFIETYFKPAFNNIKENLGQGAINEDAKMSCALLENAKSQYKILRFKPQIAINSSTSSSNSNISENNAVRMTLKRPVPNKPTSSVFEMQKRFLPDNMVIKSTAIQQTMPQQHLQSQQQQQQIVQVLPSMATIETNVSQNQNTTAFVQQQQQQQQQQLPQQATTTNLITVQSQQPQTHHPRRQIFWNTAHISTNTKFVLDVQANQAFGFGTEGKERLASKHPELIRYLPDNEDRDWLINQQIIPQQNRNSRFLFLIYDEVCRLYQTHENYKNKSTIDLSVMMTFTVPDFMIQKMKVFFVDLNIKSRGLITNSYSMAGATTATIHQPLPQPQPQQQQQQIQNQQQQQQSNSHLRNALLLGTQQSLGATSNATVSSNITSDSTTSATSSSASSTSSSSITSTETILQQKTKSSNLSSSHATLTALLNNSSTASSTSTSTNTSVLNDKSNSSTNLSALSLSTPTLLNKLRK